MGGVEEKTFEDKGESSGNVGDISIEESFEPDRLGGGVVPDMTDALNETDLAGNG